MCALCACFVCALLYFVCECEWGGKWRVDMGWGALLAEILSCRPLCLHMSCCTVLFRFPTSLLPLILHSLQWSFITNLV